MGVIPLECEAKEKRASPVNGNGEHLFECLDEVVGVFFTNKFHTEIVNNKGEGDRLCGMTPKGGCMRNRVIPKRGKVRCEAVVGNAPGLFEAGHALLNFDVDHVVGSDKVAQLVLDDDFLWYE